MRRFIGSVRLGGTWRICRRLRLSSRDVRNQGEELSGPPWVISETPVDVILIRRRNENYTTRLVHRHFNLSASSNNIRKRLFRLPEVPHSRPDQCSNHAQGKQKSRQVDGVFAAENCPAEAVDDADHGIQ